MCGIVALFSPSGGIREAPLGAATQALRHRGPDDRRVWVAPHGRIGLGHARLAIIDLTTGQQPMANEDESLHIVVNGEFYDYEAVSDELKRKGHPFRTCADSEIALHLYEELGEECLKRLRGEFAFVLWDEAKGRVFAARDRFGIKPLFYSTHGDTLHLASEVKALLAAGVPAAWDREAVHQVLTFGALLPGRTLFKDVFQVPPGHTLVATAEGTRLAPYWDFDYPLSDGEAEWKQEDEAAFIERFRAALDDAVRTRLRADVPVGCYLSGGLDSSAVMGLAARHARGPLKAFTVGFDSDGYDETDLAAETARRWGADWCAIRVSGQDLADSFADHVWHGEMACSNAHGVAKFLLSRAVRDAGYKVVLTGEGSDEILAGYPVFRLDAPAAGRAPKAPSPMPAPPAIASVPRWLESGRANALRYHTLLEPSFAAEFGDRDAQAFLRELDASGQLEGRSALNRSLYLWARTVLPNYILTVAGDRMEMAHSVEGRLPFLDHPVVELTREMPASLRFRGPAEKYVLREAARSVLTDSAYRRAKQPFQAPPALLTPGGPLETYVLDVLRSEALAALPFYDRSKVLDLLEELPRMEAPRRASLDPVLMRVVSLCVMRERFGL